MHSNSQFLPQRAAGIFVLKLYAVFLILTYPGGTGKASVALNT